MDALRRSQGPFLASQIRSGDPYELSQGHPIHCLPTGGFGSKAEGAGFKVLSTDPAVEEIGIDTGFSPRPDTLRAPNLAIGKIGNGSGWVEGAPRLAVEYAGVGQDEVDLKVKIAELLEAGTEFIWVVRLKGPRRVEVHRPGAKPETFFPDQELLAPGILQNPVPVAALFDHDHADTLAFRNLLQRHGYEDLAAVRSEGRDEGEIKALREGLLTVIEARRLRASAEQMVTVENCRDLGQLKRWLRLAATEDDLAEVLAP